MNDKTLVGLTCKGQSSTRRRFPCHFSRQRSKGECESVLAKREAILACCREEVIRHINITPSSEQPLRSPAERDVTRDARLLGLSVKCVHDMTMTVSSRCVIIDDFLIIVIVTTLT